VETRTEQEEEEEEEEEEERQGREACGLDRSDAQARGRSHRGEGAVTHERRLWTLLSFDILAELEKSLGRVLFV
jgi:hypothetical protein